MELYEFCLSFHGRSQDENRNTEVIFLKGQIFNFALLAGMMCLNPCSASVPAATEFTASALKAMGAPNNPRVEVAWNRYYDWSQIGEIGARLASNHPGLVRLSSIGKSVQGRDLHLLTVTDFKAGDPERKPAMYIDGNIHSNEIQGAEVALYTAWYLAESYGRIDWITDLLQRVTFYIVPTINPDARDFFIHSANTPSSPRSGMLPRDDDGDGLLDEDGLDDLDGDGHIVMMRRRNPNGRWRTDADDPRLLVRVEPDRKGEYDHLGWEGIDNDGDGRINEDGPGFYDPNRNWGYNWQPAYVQWGSDQYPFSIPENRAVADFVLAHSNIAGAQSYHNSGGMILRGPGAEMDADLYNQIDVRVYDILAERGEEMLPGYDYVVIYRDMYTVYGGELDWFYGARGIFTFSNELWTSFDYFRRESEGGWSDRSRDLYRFDKLLLFEEGIVPWRAYDHPQYGAIEIGGIKKSWTRTAPSFLLEDLCHRNMAFTLYHAFHLPRLEIDSTAVVKLPGGVCQVDIRIRNDRVIPTRSQHEIRNKITAPDRAVIEGCAVLAGFRVEDPYLGVAHEQEHRPERLMLDSVPGMDSVQLRWLVKGGPPYTVTVDSEKGGYLRIEIE